MSRERALRLPAVLLCCLLLSACSTVKDWFTFDDEDDAGRPADLVDIVSQIRVKKLWSAGVGNGQGDGFYKLQPVIDGDRIYAASNNGHVVALDRNSGKRLWKEDLDYSLSGGVGVGAGMLLLGTSDGEVIALSDADGSELWVGRVSGEVLAAPQTNGQVVVVQSYNGKLYGLDAADGAERWVYDSNVPVLTLRGTSTPIIYERFAIGAFGNGRVVALDVASGAVRWEARVAIAQGRSEIDRIVDIDGNMLLVEPVLYAVSYQGRLAALDVPSGRKLRQEEVSSYVGLAQGFGNIYVSEESGTLIAFYRNSSGIRWEQGALTNRQIGTPAVIKGYVAVSDLEGYVHFLSQVDGQFVGRERFDGDGIRADMLVVDDVLYVFGNGGSLAAYRVSARDSN